MADNDIEPRKCPFDLPTDPQMPGDKLHRDAALFQYEYGDLDGAGGHRALGTAADDDDRHPARGDLDRPGREQRQMLRDAAQLVTEAEAVLDLAVRTARDHGATWASIAGPLKMTKQGAQQRFGSTK